MLMSVAQCKRLDECTIYIYCDAAKVPTHQSAVDESRKVVAEFSAQLGAQIIRRDVNLGLARSIVDGVTSLVQRYERVIVLEDDLIVSPDFLDYMLQSLDHFRDASQVYQISGFCFPIQPRPTDDTFFLPLATTWGWATWARAWQAFDWDPPQVLNDLSDPSIRSRFDLDDSYPYTRMLQDRLGGRNDSWGILWWYAIFKAGGLVLYPRESLVRNDGFDGSGIHSGNDKSVAQSLSKEVASVSISTPLTFPATIQINSDVWSSMKMFLRHQQEQGSSTSVLRRVRTKLGNVLKGVRS
ncbi:MAG: hemolysin activation protein [Chloroflexi bacterium]|nr:hemolysin activation protein [Chloroflexota bacterium]